MEKEKVMDLIDRQAAIDAIEEMQMPIMRSEFPEEQFVFTGMSEALNAIKRLPSAQPDLQPTCNQLATDCISRQAAIDAVKEEEYPCESDYDEGYMAALDKAVWIIEKWLPSAQPERKTGFWYALEKGDKGYSAGDFKCSVCGEPNHTWLPKPSFCPNCGADMREQP